MKHSESLWVSQSSSIYFACLVSCSCPRKWTCNTKLLFDQSTGTWLQTHSGDHWADWSRSWPADAWREGGKPDRATQAHLYAVPAVHQDAYLQPRGCAPSQGQRWYIVVKQSRYVLPGSNSLFLSIMLPLSVLSNLPWKPFFFLKHFRQSYCLEINVCVWCACVDMHLNLCCQNMYVWKICNT